MVTLYVGITDFSRVQSVLAETLDRHSPIGIYHLGESYFRTAEYLSQKREERQLRIRFFYHIELMIYAHAIELLMKAFMRKAGVSNQQLRRKYGHNLPRLWKDCRNAGMKTKWWKRLEAVIRALDFHISRQDFRYYETGSIPFPSLKVVHDTAEELLRVVRGRVLK